MKLCDICLKTFRDNYALKRHQSSKACKDIANDTQKTIVLNKNYTYNNENSDNTIETPISDFKDMKANFKKAHKEQFGFVMQKTDIILEFIEVEASGGATQTQKFNPSPKKNCPEPMDICDLYFGGGWHKTAMYYRSQINEELMISGPAVIIEKRI